MEIFKEKEFQNYDNFDNLFNFWATYSGDFKNNSFNGIGTLILCNGEKFLGLFNLNKIHGEGTFFRMNGLKETGIW